jgi:hypothetical protein
MTATIALAGVFECMSGALASTHMACCAAMQHDCHDNATASDCCLVEAQDHLTLGAVKEARDLTPPLEPAFESLAPAVDLVALFAWDPVPGGPDSALRVGPPPVYLLNTAFLI